MSKQHLVAFDRVPVFAAILLAAVALAGPVSLPAQGGSEEAGRDTGRDDAAPAANESQSAGDAVRVFDVGLEAAIDRASRTPESWDYDPRERVIHPQDANIEYPVVLPEGAWRDLLDPNEYYVLRQKGTEPAFTHPLNDNTRAGIYYSRATGQPLFRSEDKYDSRSGWPSFTRPINPDAIVYVEDNSLFMRRIEVVDSLSGSHLGHVFSDGPQPTGQRYCINGAALVFVPYGEEPPPIRTAGP